MIDKPFLAIMGEDIYFLTGLSCQGEFVNLKGGLQRGFFIQYYINIYCSVNMKKGATEVLVQNNIDLSLKIFILAIMNIVSSTSPYLDSRVYIYYVFDYI